MATAIMLNGTSSAGKTTVARAFQNVAPRRFLNFSIDDILYALPQKDIDHIEHSADLSDLRLPELVRAFYACVRQLLELGYDVIFDHAVTARYHAELLREATAGHDVLLVGLDCPAEVLRERERSRGDRRVGLAEAQFGSIHSQLEYDVFLDTSTTSPEDAAARIAEALAKKEAEPR